MLSVQLTNNELLTSNAMLGIFRFILVVINNIVMQRILHQVI